MQTKQAILKNYFDKNPRSGDDKRKSLSNTYVERETSCYDFGVVVDDPCPEPPFFLPLAVSCFATRKNSTFFSRRKSAVGVKRICVFEMHSVGLKSSSFSTAFDENVGRNVPSGPPSTMYPIEQYSLSTLRNC